MLQSVRQGRCVDRRKEKDAYVVVLTRVRNKIDQACVCVSAFESSGRRRNESRLPPRRVGTDIKWGRGKMTWAGPWEM